VPGSVSVQNTGILPFAKSEGWGTRMLVAGEEEALVGSFRAAFEETFVERLPALESSFYGVPVINLCFA
jgi:hypothetical protein